MNRNDFIKIIRDSGQVDRQMIGEIRELIDLFPWFQSAHMLLLKGLHDTEDVKFENQLKQSAYHIADREVLYYLLERKPVQLPGQVEINSTGAEVHAYTHDNEQVVIETGKNSHEIISELERNTIVMNHLAESYAEEKEFSKQPFFITAESESDESASVILVIDSQGDHFEETVVYMDPSISYHDSSDLLELDTEEIEIPVPDGRVSTDEALPVKKESRKQLQSDLIEKFILTNPRIEPVREKSDKPVEDISKPYVEEKGGLVTETLAKIYISQGYYSRAIDIYEKLSLKFPEKSSYFATQIEKVKGLIK
jgi:hypothetical protein